MKKGTLKKYNDTKKQIAELGAQLESLRQEILSEIPEQGEVEQGAYRAIVKLVEQKRFDSKAFKEAHADLYEQFRMEVEYQTIKIEAK